MSSRVEQENQARQAETERLNKRVERESRDQRASETSRNAFAKLVKTTQEGQSETRRTGERVRADLKQGEQQSKAAQQSEQAERGARASRAGNLQQGRILEQARSFQGALSNQSQQTHESDRARVEAREQGMQKDSVENDDRGVDLSRKETQRDAEGEIKRTEARDQGRPNAAISGDPNEQRGGGHRGGREQHAPAPAIEAATGRAGVREVKQIPPELLERLVSAVHLAVNEKGLKEFHIELKDGPLKGATLKISANDGKVALRFENLGSDEKRLVEASKGELMRRLEGKGLVLSRLDVK